MSFNTHYTEGVLKCFMLRPTLSGTQERDKGARGGQRRSSSSLPGHVVSPMPLHPYRPMRQPCYRSFRKKPSKSDEVGVPTVDLSIYTGENINWTTQSIIECHSD